MIEKEITLKIKAENLDCFLSFVQNLRVLCKKYLLEGYLIKDINIEF